MLDTTTQQKEIAVRLYENKKYGTTFGKGKYRTAIYNGTADMKDPQRKYLLDLYSYDDWMNYAVLDEQMDIIKNTEHIKDALYSWVFLYDTNTKLKVFIGGVAIYDLNDGIFHLIMDDKQIDICDQWTLDVKPCRILSGGAKSPQLLATNSDLSVW
jgi:hypothetical protein